MNQEDFRRLLAAGGGGDDARAYGGKRNLTDADLAEIRRLSKKPKKKSKKPVSKPSKQEDEPDEAQEPRYRDRAAERRQGVKSGDMVDADQFAHLDAEQSKFLGGDVEHTHLVKGLDFALLAQLKREKEKLQKAAEDAKQQRPGGSGASSAPTKASKLTFSTRMGRLVYFHACQSDPSAALGNGKAFTKSELFLPGRMDYTFNLSELEMESIPVAVQRSKDDCPEPDDVAHGIVDEELISRISVLLSHQQAGKKLRRKKRDHLDHSGNNHGEAGEEDTEMVNEDTSNSGEARAGATGKESKVEEDDDDENIFSDVDDYIPVDQRTDDREPTAEEKAAIKSKGYFSNLSASISASERAEREKEEEAANAWKATLKKAVAAQARKEQEEAQLAKAKRLAAMANSKDEYSEYQAEGAYEDSDDEEGGGGGGDGDGKKKKKKSSGEEVSETELARRKQQKQSNKLQSDLEKISKIMDKKEGGR